MLPQLKSGDYVRTPSGMTGKIKAIISNDGFAHVQVASGSWAGQLRKLKLSSLEKI